MFVSYCRWRLQIRKALSPTQKANSTTTTNIENENKEDEDDRMLNEMEELTYAMERKKKRTKKLLAKRRAKVWFEVIITTLAVIPCS
jgi:AdoMet-dependent rRNA methyltransferase SPB1